MERLRGRIEGANRSTLNTEAFMDVSLSDLNEHIRDLRTVLTGLGYALGRQSALNADDLRTDLLEICLPSKGSPGTVAHDLATSLGQAIARGKEYRKK